MLKSSLVLLFTFFLSNIFAHSINTRVSFSENEKLFNFGLSYNFSEGLILGINRSRDIIGSDLVERNTKIWSMLIYEKSLWTPSLIYSKDNNGRVGLGVELNYDYYLSQKLTLLLGVSILSYEKDVNEIRSNYSLVGNEDYAKTSLSYGFDYFILDDLVARLNYKKYYYDDYSSVSLRNSIGSTITSYRDFSTRGQLMETFIFALEYSFKNSSLYSSIERSPIILEDQTEYWYLLEFTHKISKHLQGSIHVEYENLDDTFYSGLGLKYSFN
jgi:hypothetical protein